MRLIFESAGDRTLHKFIIFKIPKIDGIEDSYDDVLKGYLFSAEYKYNIYTRETNDRMITHFDILDIDVPIELKDHYLNSIIYGKTDCFQSGENEEYPIRLLVWGNSNKLKNDDLRYLKQLFNADKVSGHKNI